MWTLYFLFNIEMAIFLIIISKYMVWIGILKVIVVYLGYFGMSFHRHPLFFFTAGEYLVDLWWLSDVKDGLESRTTISLVMHRALPMIMEWYYN